MEQVIKTIIAATFGSGFVSDDKNFEQFNTGQKKLSPYEVDLDDPPSTVTMSLSKTYDLKHKESARVVVSFGLTAKESDADDAFNYMEAMVHAAQEWERTNIYDQKPECAPPEEFLNKAPFDVYRVSMYIEYKLTLNVGEWEFVKPSIGIRESCDPAEFKATLSGIQARLRSHIKAQVVKARNPKSALPNIDSL